MCLSHENLHTWVSTLISVLRFDVSLQEVNNAQHHLFNGLNYAVQEDYHTKLNLSSKKNPV